MRTIKRHTVVSEAMNIKKTLFTRGRPLCRFSNDLNLWRRIDNAGRTFWNSDFNCLSRSLFRIDTVAHSISAISKPIYITRRLHHRVCGRTSFVIRADFSPIAPGSAPREEEERTGLYETEKGDRKRRRLHLLHGRVACCTGREDSVRPSGHYRRVIIILRSATRSLLQRASFTYRDSPRMRRRRRTWRCRRNAGHPGEKKERRADPRGSLTEKEKN